MDSFDPFNPAGVACLVIGLGLVVLAVLVNVGVF